MLNDDASELYLYITSYYNFRLQLISEAIIEMDCNIDDKNMVNVAADIEEVRDVIPALMPRLHIALAKRECEGCTIYHPSQTQHQCLDPVDEIHYICSRIREVGKQIWKNRFNDTEREKEYVQMKESPINESFADGNVGAGVRLMVRGGCLPVRGSDRMT